MTSEGENVRKQPLTNKEGIQEPPKWDGTTRIKATSKCCFPTHVICFSVALFAIFPLHFPSPAF